VLFDESSFCKLLRAVSKHPSLRKLDFTGIDSDNDTIGTKANKAAAKTIRDNKQLEGIRIKDDDDYYDSPFDPDTWHALITPTLECNVYRKRFPAIRKVVEQSTRAAVLASTLAHVSNKPSPAFMLLRQNIDILASYDPQVEPRMAPSSRKRSRSPSSDGIVVSSL
jgi:hypothetical protein